MYTMFNFLVISACVVTFLISSVASVEVTINNTTVNGRVLGGGLAEKGQFPWQTGIFYSDVYICAGVLVSLNHVLTTRNCMEKYAVFPEYITVRMGSLHITDKAFEKKVKKIDLNHKNDNVAMIQLNSEIESTTELHAISIIHTHEIEYQDEVQLSGWGESAGAIYEELRYINTTVAFELLCDLAVGSSSNKGTYFCTDGMDSNSDPIGACPWDEGSGLVHVEPATMVQTLVGIVGKGQCDHKFEPTIYVSTLHYKDWIMNEINSSS